METSKPLQLFAAVSLPVACLVLGLKYWAYHVTGSIALYSDALESIINVIAALAAFITIRISMKPADHDHNFGHHKAEYFSAVLEGVLIIIAAVLILKQAWSGLNAPKMPTQSFLGVFINVVSSLINGIWALVLVRQGRLHRSPALKADGVHLFVDVFTSIAVVIGVGMVYFTGWAILDPLIAFFVAINILWQGWKVIDASVQGLMDVGVDLEESVRIRDTICSNASGALEVHDLKTRLAGSIVFIEFDLVVRSEMTVADAHAICDNIETALKKTVPTARVTIHLEPDNEAKLPIGSISVPFASNE